MDTEKEFELALEKWNEKWNDFWKKQRLEMVYEFPPNAHDFLEDVTFLTAKKREDVGDSYIIILSSQGDEYRLFVSHSNWKGRYEFRLSEKKSSSHILHISLQFHLDAEQTIGIEKMLSQFPWRKMTSELSTLYLKKENEGLKHGLLTNKIIHVFEKNKKMYAELENGDVFQVTKVQK